MDQMQMNKGTLLKQPQTHENISTKLCVAEKIWQDMINSAKQVMVYEIVAQYRSRFS